MSELHPFLHMMAVLLMASAALLVLWATWAVIAWLARAMTSMFDSMRSHQPRGLWEWFCKITVYVICGPIWLVITVFVALIPFINMYFVATTVRNWWHASDSK